MLFRSLMGIKHHPTSAEPVVHPNGSRAFYNQGDGCYRSVAKVEGCPCEDGALRTAHATAEADSFWSVPACVYVGRKTVGGQLLSGMEGWTFVVDRNGRNAALIEKS